MLANPVYAGRVCYRGESYEGQHEALVDRQLWDRVQRRLAARHTGPRNAWHALLAGLVRCAVCGRGMGHTPQRKGNKVFRFYVCDTINESGAAACPGSRVPAQVLEDKVLEELVNLGNPARGEVPPEVRHALASLRTVGDALTAEERAGLVGKIVASVRYDSRTQGFEITMNGDASNDEAKA
jgi:site-specific DNA recombinase